MFRWGVLSTAKIGRDQVIPAIVEAENGVLSAIASRDLSKARALAERFGAPHAFGSYEELLASDTVDGVYIPLPTSQHVEWTAKAIEAGKHVLVEKPLALDAKDILPLIELAQRARRCWSAKPSWSSTIRNGRRCATSSAPARSAGCAMCRAPSPISTSTPTNMRNQLSLGGGALPDIGVYPTVSTRFVTGKEPARVQATIERDKTFGTDIYSSIRADFGDFELSFYLSTQMANRQLMVFHGDKAFIEVHSPFNAGLYDHHRVELHNQGHTEATVFRFPGTQQYKLEVETFARAAQGGKDEVFTLENSVLNQKVIDAIFRAGDKDGAWEKV